MRRTLALLTIATALLLIACTPPDLRFHIDLLPLLAPNGPIHVPITADAISDQPYTTNLNISTFTGGLDLHALLSEATLELQLAITPDASVEHFAYQVFISPPSTGLDNTPILWGELLIVDLTPGNTIEAELRLSTHDVPAVLDALRSGEFGFGIRIEALEPVTFSPRAIGVQPTPSVLIELQHASLELVASPLALLN